MTILISLLVLNAGVVVDAHALRGIAQQIARAKQTDPDAFRALARLRDEGTMKDFQPALERMGVRGLWPMLELIGFDAPPVVGDADGASLTFEIALIDAAGALRDRRAAPVFEVVLRSDGQPFAVYRAAAAALARVSDEATSAELITLSQGSGMKQDAILAGMGVSTRPTVAHALVAALEAHPAPSRAANVIHGLVGLGSVTASNDEGERLRDEAAKALVGAYVSYDGEVRQAASNALVAVDAPHTELFIENEKMRGVALPELRQLEQRLAKAPEH